MKPLEIKLKIVGRKNLEFHILHQCGEHEIVADITNRTIKRD